ncbi:WD repeat-containing protein 44 [Phtheirospermum japonicum]|uniref:WD repeat-containing protein 44 n=1 Tax=Phtheirospermum japonicum TaxID=374723 RepID=A0A830CCC3_9LAMI|nr:WD repeat-containing protein 44 [Phtheirospermum japonicum]
MKNLKKRWWSKLRSMTCLMSRNTNTKDDDVGPGNLSRFHETRIRRVRVRHCRRRSKEISALFTGQDIKAHEGAIMAMKFSHDGRYLASAGEDKIVRIWQVVEDERLDTNIDVPDLDPSCVYFSANHLSELGPVTVEKDKIKKSKGSFGKTQDSACIVFPPKVFRILEKPLHAFEGHNGEILDLSWAKNNCLLSSSVDKTVRLWRVGVDHCIKIFPHSDYVTSIQFNPVNDEYFVSGSIDGKVRIWAIGDCKVVDWTETSDIITAVSYRPDGQSGIIGSITGTCRFFDLSDNHFQLGAHMCLTSKKKSPCKRITAFQFLPQDPSKILVTCADSKVRIIDGMNVTGKYKGLRNGGNQISASFTSDGKHIVSASDDSNVYIWNYTDQSQPKAVRSFECFSSDASIAVPWPGPKPTGPQERSPPFSPSDYFSLSQDYFLDSISKGSATWPEEKLPVSTSPQTLSKSQYKLFKSSCQSSSDSHAWGLVIVTAGWDGRIKSFHNYGLPVSL